MKNISRVLVIVLIALFTLSTTVNAQTGIPLNALTLMKKVMEKPKNLWHLSGGIKGPDQKWYSTFSHIGKSGGVLTMTLFSVDSGSVNPKVKEILLTEEEKKYHWYNGRKPLPQDKQKINTFLTSEFKREQ